MKCKEYINILLLQLLSSSNNYLHFNTNLGAYAAVKLGIEKSSGE